MIITIPAALGYRESAAFGRPPHRGYNCSLVGRAGGADNQYGCSERRKMRSWIPPVMALPASRHDGACPAVCRFTGRHRGGGQAHAAGQASTPSPPPTASTARQSSIQQGARHPAAGRASDPPAEGARGFPGRAGHRPGPQSGRHLPHRSPPLRAQEHGPAAGPLPTGDPPHGRFLAAFGISAERWSCRGTRQRPSATTRRPAGPEGERTLVK